MKALILAAGFGSRLERGFQDYLKDPANSSEQKELVRAWVEGKPKGLIPVKGKPIVDYLLEQLAQAGIEKEKIYIQTNALHYPYFESWAKNKGIPAETNIINNQRSSNKNRRGPIGDLCYALERIGYEQPLLVLAQDTLVFDAEGRLYDLRVMADKYYKSGNSSMVVYQGEKSRLSNHGLVEVVGGRAARFEEKPAVPKSDLINASVYLYSPAVLHWIKDTFADWEKYRDRNFLEFIDFGELVFEVEKASSRLDIGRIEDVLEANKEGL